MTTTNPAAPDRLLSADCILVVGSINQDTILHVTQTPEPGETVLALSLRVTGGGKGANQAIAAARAGANVAFLGCVGDDEAGRSALTALTAGGISTTAVKVTNTAPTGSAYVIVTADGENSIVVAPGANHQLRPGDIDAAGSLFDRNCLVVVQLELPPDTVARTIELAHTAGAPILLNLAPAARLSRELLSAVTVLVVNENEATTLAGNAWASDPSALLQLGPAAVVVTLGSQGAMWTQGGGFEKVAAAQINVVDTTGAGDAFVGTLAAALVSGLDVDAAIGRAMQAGAAATTVVGAR
jgi:ribokinase